MRRGAHLDVRCRSACWSETATQAPHTTGSESPPPPVTRLETPDEPPVRRLACLAAPTVATVGIGVVQYRSSRVGRTWRRIRNYETQTGPTHGRGRVMAPGMRIEPTTCGLTDHRNLSAASARTASARGFRAVCLSGMSASVWWCAFCAMACAPKAWVATVLRARPSRRGPRVPSLIRHEKFRGTRSAGIRFHLYI